MIIYGTGTTMIIALAGNTGAGKSALARIIKKPLNARILTVAYILKANARKQGIPFERYMASIESKHGPTAHIRALENIIREKLKKYRTVIVEGTYKIQDIATLQQLFPQESIYVFYIKSEKDIRIKRIMKRKELSKDEAIKWVNRQDTIRKFKFKMGTVAQIADGRIINTGLTQRELSSEFLKQFKSAVIARVATTLKNRVPIKTIRMPRG